MKYCTKCLYPDTKPNLSFNKDGVCSACTAYEARKSIDWAAREEQFRELAFNTLGGSGKRDSVYDCIVPVSGGKDSHYQVLKCLEYGLRPLAVTAMTDDLTPLGWRNLNNISKLGVDHVMVQVNQRIRRRINKYALETVGDISWPEHVLIFTVPIREAFLRGIPLIVYGENSQNEYGGPLEAQTATRMDRRWLEEFGGLNDLRVSDIVDAEIASEEDMEQYTWPDADLVEKAGIEAIFLGQFFEWDGQANAEKARAHGFEYHTGIVEGGLYTYENLDCSMTGLHDYQKFTKFGFGRATDHACNMIRRGTITRDEGLAFVQQLDGQFPWTYLGVPLTRILDDIGMARDEFMACIAKFTDPKLFDIDPVTRVPIAKFKPAQPHGHL